MIRPRLSKFLSLYQKSKSEFVIEKLTCSGTDILSRVLSMLDELASYFGRGFAKLRPRELAMDMNKVFLPKTAGHLLFPKTPGKLTSPVARGV